MSFIEKIRAELNSATKLTENGAVGYVTSGKYLLDCNFKISSYRNYDESRILNDFMKAFFEEPVLAIKWLFFVRDIRGGVGERRLFRIIMVGLAKQYPQIAVALAPLIAEYGRYDDLLALYNTPVKKTILGIVTHQLNTDIINMGHGKPISLLAKWMPSENASSRETIKLAREISLDLKLTAKAYRKFLSKLRAHLDVVERKMSAKKWEDITYKAVPSRANLIYNDAFLRNDENRRRQYLAKVESGEEKINAGVLFPHDIVHKYGLHSSWGGFNGGGANATLEALWKALPDYVQGEDSTIVVADGSGSMYSAKIGKTKVMPIEVANALSIYFAERCKGEFKNKYITFSCRPQLVNLNGSSLYNNIKIATTFDEVANTDITAVFKLILNTAIKNKMMQDELPKTILIISDMEFDAGTSYVPLMDAISKKFEDAGYILPKIAYWNVASRTCVIPMQTNENGVVLVSGFSPAIVKQVLSNKNDPYEVLIEALNNERYDAVEEALKNVE